MGDCSGAPATATRVGAVDGTVKHGLDTKKPGLQVLIRQLSDSVSLIAKEVEEIQWENLQLKCQLDAYRCNEKPVVLEVPECNSAPRDEPGQPDTDEAWVDDGDGAVSNMESNHVSRDDSKERVEQQPSAAMGGAKSQGHQFMMRARWMDYRRYRNVKLTLPERHSQTKVLTDSDRSFYDDAKSYDDRGGHVACVVNPSSRYRLLWVLGCVVLLLYDVIVVPMNVCFDMSDTSFTKVMDMIAMIYWTLDIPFTFLTGLHTSTHLEMRLLPIAIHYAKGWLIFDIFLVLPEYVTMLIDDFPGAEVSVFRMARWGRLMRLLRLARVARVQKMKAALRYLALHFHLSKMYVELTQGWFGMNLMFFLIIHLISCIWYAFGNLFDKNWVVVNNLEAADVGRLYSASFWWTCSRLHGMFSGYRVETVPELVFDSILTFLSLAAVAIYFGMGATVVMARMNSKPLNLWKVSVNYIGRHNITPNVAMRVQKSLEASHYLCAGEIEADEHMLLNSVPPTVRFDLVYESRCQYVQTNVFFDDLAAGHHRTLRELCNVATASHVIVQSEVIFDDGDAGHHMRIIQSGAFNYKPHSGEPAKRLTHTDNVSEAVLWVNWVHVGRMQAMEESLFIAVDAHKLCEVVVQHELVCMHAFRYAKHFAWRLNHTEAPDDLISFPELTREVLNEDLFEGTNEDHFVFISHYKVEAGTEATLIRDHLEPILVEDQAHPGGAFEAPIFIDSEDLTDLARLKEHVKKSQVLMLLLTPGVLSRPWCLVEIVTAVRTDGKVNIVPVEVQRPGSKYSYPSEEFYTQIVNGNFLDANATGLLKEEGISLEEVAQAIRRVFLKISLPFSPHKTKVVREAELHDILKRCNEHLQLENSTQANDSLQRKTS